MRLASLLRLVKARATCHPEIGAAPEFSFSFEEFRWSIGQRRSLVPAIVNDRPWIELVMPVADERRNMPKNKVLQPGAIDHLGQ